MSRSSINHSYLVILKDIVPNLSGYPVRWAEKYRRAIAHPMRPVADRPGSGHGCSRFLKGLTGPCSAIAGVRIVTVGVGQELVDDNGHIAQAYGIDH